MSLTSEIEWLVNEMKAAEQPSKAANMSAYLKNKFECLGVKAPIRNEIQSRWFNRLKGQEFDPWDLAYNLWDRKEREFQYIAIDYLKKLPLKKYQKDDYLKFEELIVTKSWWETVDSLASSPVGKYFKAYSEMIDPVITRWRNSENMWLNRTTLIFQLKYKHELDFELLKGLIIQFMPVKEFFIQKAIGWSLRQHSKADPEAVKEFVKHIELSTVAKREAYKYI